MASDDRKTRLWPQPNQPILRPHRAIGEGVDTFGRYRVISLGYNREEDWYCKHQYFDNETANSYHYINKSGWYYSMNPDGSEEILHVKQKRAEYCPPGGEYWKDCSKEVDWNQLPEIPDRCIATRSCPGPRIWQLIEQLEHEQGVWTSPPA